MGTDPFLFWPNFYLYNYEYKCIANITRKNNLSGRRFHGIFWFADDLFVSNVGDEFGKAFFEIYPTELELKAKNNGSHATFPDLDNSIDQGRFIDKRLDKWDAFNPNIVKMASIISNIPSIILHSSTSSYKIVRQILKLIVIAYQQMFITRN